jgi:hypothetical protein
MVLMHNRRHVVYITWTAEERLVSMLPLPGPHWAGSQLALSVA